MSLFEDYCKNGYLVISNFVSKAVCEKLINRANILIDNDSVDCMLAFSASDQSHAQHQYFLESANKISLFYEPESFGLFLAAIYRT